MTLEQIIHFITSGFVYNENSVLIFTRYTFWVFFAIAYLIYVKVYKKIALRNSYLFLISLFFYYKVCGLFFILLIFSTVVDYFIGLSIHKANNERKRLTLLVVSIFVNLLVLSYFKYAYFFTESYNAMFDTNLEVINRLSQLSNYFL